MTAYPVYVALRARPGKSTSIDVLLESVMESFADVDARDEHLLDWSVGADTSAMMIDIDLTVAADHHADAVAHAHEVVRRVAAVVEATGKGVLEDFGNPIRVFA